MTGAERARLHAFWYHVSELTEAGWLTVDSGGERIDLTWWCPHGSKISLAVLRADVLHGAATLGRELVRRAQAQCRQEEEVA